LPEGEKLLVKDPKIIGLSSNQEKEIENFVTQKANKRLTGLLPVAYLAYIYELGALKYDTALYSEEIRSLDAKYDLEMGKINTTRKIKRIQKKKNRKKDKINTQLTQGNYFMRLGEPLAIYDKEKHTESIDKIALYLSSKGYFNTSINLTEKIKNKKIKLNYEIKLLNQYLIDSIRYDIDDKSIKELLEEDQAIAFLMKGTPYDQQNINKERARIYNVLSDNGYYKFDKKYITFDLDTALIKKNSLWVAVKVSSPPQQDYHNKYTVRAINFYSSKNTGSKKRNKLTEEQQVVFDQNSDGFNKKILSRNISIKQDHVYNKSEMLTTQQRLNLLDTYKFININYDTIDQNNLIAQIFSSPMDNYQTSNEIGFLQDDFSQVLPGPFVNLGLKKRNAFGNFEMAELNLNFSLLGISNIDSREQPYSLFEYGGRLAFTFHHFLFPLSENFIEKTNELNPRTRISFYYSYEDRTKEYERNQIFTDFSYLWAKNKEKQFIFTPFGINYTEIRQIDPSFQNFLNAQDTLGNRSLSAAFKPSLTTLISFEAIFNQNNYGNLSTHSSFLRLLTESGGLYVNAFENLLPDSNFTLFQWLKFNVDFRSHMISKKGQIAFKINLGAAFAYGDAQALPYERRFYAGGSNSIRAWPVRRLGPGAYAEATSMENRSIDDQVAQISYQREQGGDLIIETSIEYRNKLTNNLNYAFFADMGNIWLLNSSQSIQDYEGDDGKFRLDSFYKELAVGIGLGLRYDFSFMILRLDGAIQVVDPGQPIGQRYILNQLLSQNGFFRNKSNINIGIGLPF
jgi:outer membrane protein insertion porin family